MEVIIFETKKFTKSNFCSALKEPRSLRVIRRENSSTTNQKCFSQSSNMEPPLTECC